MKRIARLILFVFACCIVAALYAMTPLLLHSHSQIVNFLQLVAVAVAMVVCAFVLIGGMMLGAGRSLLTAPPPVRTAPAPRVPDTVREVWRHVDAASPSSGNTETLDQAHRRIDHLADALRIMVSNPKPEQPKGV